MSEQSHDIEKYLRGELTPAEMHALEKRALDDPFLADALEGASQLSQDELTSDLQSLHKSLNERVEEKKVIPMWGWTMRIAAGLILVAVSTFVIINLNKDSDEDNLAMTEKQEVDSIQSSEQKRDVAAATETDSSKAGNELLALEQEDDRADNWASKSKSAPKKSAQPGESIASSTTPAERPVATIAAEQPTIDTLETQMQIADAAPVVAAPERSEVSDDADKVAKEDAAGRRAKNISVSPAPSKDGFTKTDKNIENSNVAFRNSQSGIAFKDSFAIEQSKVGGLTKVTGRVTAAEDGTGLPGVNVVIKGTSTGTVTDINGNYQIEVTDPYSTLVYSFIGLESMEQPINNTTIVDATMQQDVAQLSEVVVTGFGEVDYSGPTHSTFEMAEPLGGRRAFKKYLEDKLIYPQQAIANKIEGKVTVQFIVETTGKLSNFNVVKGIGYGCDEELIRLIKQGPKWSATKRDDELVKSRVRVRIRFSLPKKK